MSTKNLKEQVKEHWDNEPCGTRDIPYPEGTIEYYEAVSDNRYNIEKWIYNFAEFDNWSNKKVLEVGCGTGSDLIEFLKSGADITGIDLSSKSISLAKKRLEVYNFKGKVLEADAEKLPFEDNSFFMVYSNGVLHHTPNMGKAISEIYRVLKPNSEIRIMLYHKPSIVCLQMWILFGLLKGKPFRKLDDIFYNHHESIGTKVLTINEVKKLFNKFRNVEIKTIVTLHDIRYTRNKFLPSWFMHLVPSFLGWNILIKGIK